MLAFAYLTPAARWLARADSAPDRVYMWWANAGIALLSVGTRWEAIKTGGDCGRRALADGGLQGPVMCDPIFDHLYFLVALGTSENWQVAGTECLGADCWLKVPAPHHTRPPGAHWIQAPTGAGLLIDHSALRSALGRVS